MMNFTKLITEKYPDYKKIANKAFDSNYSIWEEPKYENKTKGRFEELKERRKTITDRTKILDLYKTIEHHTEIDDFNEEEENTLYDAFLCTMVWGKIGLYGSKIDFFKNVFDDKNKADIIAKLKFIWIILCDENKTEKERITETFDYLKKDGAKHIDGVGPAFFTKFLYFASDGKFKNIKPLIYDRVMLRTHRTILFSLGEIDKARKLENKSYNYNSDNYIEYLGFMKSLSKKEEFDLEPGHLEALLFSDEEYGNCLSCRSFIKKYEKQQLKVINKLENNNKPKEDDNQNNIQQCFWDKLRNRLSTQMKCAVIKDRSCELRKIGNGNYTLRMRVYSNGFNKNGYQAFGIDNIKDNDKVKLEKEIKLRFKNEVIDCSGKSIIIRNKNSDYANEEKRIEWFVDNINKIIEILK